MMSTLDAKKETLKQRNAFAQIRNAEVIYSRQLRAVARHIATLVKGLNPTDPTTIHTVQNILAQYSGILRPWAYSVTRRMLADVERRDYVAWVKYSRFMGASLKRELNEAPTGFVTRQLLDAQANLITSLPLDAASYVQRLAQKAQVQGARAGTLTETIAGQLAATPSAKFKAAWEVSYDPESYLLNRANLIATTEVGRAATAFTQARAQHVGSPGYIWRSSGDYKVRPELGIKHFGQLNTLAMGSHRKLDGTYHEWTNPPVAAPTGERAHPGSIWRCRCFPEVVLPSQY